MGEAAESPLRLALVVVAPRPLLAEPQLYQAQAPQTVVLSGPRLLPLTIRVLRAALPLVVPVRGELPRVPGLRRLAAQLPAPAPTTGC
jgi:hypothetical protein